MPLNKTERRFNITYLSMLIGIFPAAIFIGSYVNLKIILVPNVIDEIKESINDYPLTNLYYSSSCNQDDYSIPLYIFPGSKSGCSCLNVKYYKNEQEHKDEVFPNECNKNQSSNGCDMVKPIESRLLFKWKQGIFCSKNYNKTKNETENKNELLGYFYYLNNSVKEKESCNPGYKKCGKLDDNDNYLCLPEKEECPINDIISSEEERADLIEEGYEKIKVNDLFFYITNKKTNKPIITKLKVGEKYLCSYKQYHYTDYPQYILDNNFEKYGCAYKVNGKFYEENSVKLDSSTKYELYEDSNLTLNSKELYNSSLHEFPFHSLEEDLFLYPKRYIGFNKKCLLEKGGLNIDTFLYNENDIKKVISNDMFKYNNLIVWFSMFAFSFEVLFCSLFEIDNEKIYSTIIPWGIVNSLFYILMSVPIYINFRKLKKFTPLPLCGGSILNDKIKLFNYAAQTFKRVTISQIVFLNLQLVFIIFILVLKIKYQFWDGFKPPSYYENQKKKNKDNGESKNENKFGEEAYYEMD